MHCLHVFHVLTVSNCCYVFINCVVSYLQTKFCFSVSDSLHLTLRILHVMCDNLFAESRGLLSQGQPVTLLQKTGEGICVVLSGFLF